MSDASNAALILCYVEENIHGHGSYMRTGILTRLSIWLRSNYVRDSLIKAFNAVKRHLTTTWAQFASFLSCKENRNELRQDYAPLARRGARSQSANAADFNAALCEE